MCNFIPQGKDWIDVLTALLTPVIAIIGIIIAVRQWQISREHLKHELFERRFQVYEKIGAFIGSILVTGKLQQDKDVQFLIDTKAVGLLFDKDIKDFTSQLYQKATFLHALAVELEGTRGEERTKNLEKQTEIKNWYHEQLNSLEDRFSNFLKLRH